jgi:hypothetical protein
MSNIAPNGMTAPTIHLNGTGGERLLQQYHDQIMALDNAINVLYQTGPNARDYYVHGENEYKIARAEHDHRMKRLRDIKNELDGIWQTLFDQLHK